MFFQQEERATCSIVALIIAITFLNRCRVTVSTTGLSTQGNHCHFWKYYFSLGSGWAVLAQDVQSDLSACFCLHYFWDIAIRLLYRHPHQLPQALYSWLTDWLADRPSKHFSMKSTTVFSQSNGKPHISPTYTTLAPFPNSRLHGNASYLAFQEQRWHVCYRACIRRKSQKTAGGCLDLLQGRVRWQLSLFWKGFKDWSCFKISQW